MLTKILMILSYFKYQFGRRESNRIIFMGYACKKYNFNTKYLFEYIIKNNPEFECYFIIDDKDLRNKLNCSIGNFFISRSSLADLKLIFQAGTWITPGGLPIRIPYVGYKRVVMNLWHGIPIKGIGIYNHENNWIQNVLIKFIYSKFDSYSSTSELFQQIMSKSFNVDYEKSPILGQAWNDQLYKTHDKLEIINKLFRNQIDVNYDTKLILYAPTWRNDKNTVLFPFKDFSVQELDYFLEKNNAYIFLRTHQLDRGSFNCEYSKRIRNLNEDKVVDIMEILNIFDILVSDYSGIYMDYLLLDRPIILLPYDLEDYTSTRYLNMDYKYFSTGVEPNTFKEFKRKIQELIKEPKITSEQARLKELTHLWKDGNSCERHVDYLNRLIKTKLK